MKYYKYNVEVVYTTDGGAMYSHFRQGLYFSQVSIYARDVIANGFSYREDGGGVCYGRFIPPHRIYEVRSHQFEVSEDEYSRRE